MCSDVNRKGKSLGWYVEGFFPTVLACGVFFMLLYFKSVILLKIDKEWLDVKDIYFVVFNWCALQVGFSFAAYALVIGKIKGFIYETRATKTMKQFKRYLVRGYWTGIVISVIALAFIVIRPDLSEMPFYNYFIIAAWFSYFVFSFLCFIRIVLIFQFIARLEENTP